MTEQPKCKTCGDTGNIVKPRTGTPSVDYEPCPDCTEQPNSNTMIFEQVNGSIKVAQELLGQLMPKTSQVDGCITTLKSWQDNNLKHLQKAFE